MKKVTKRKLKEAQFTKSKTNFEAFDVATGEAIEVIEVDSHSVRMGGVQLGRKIKNLSKIEEAQIV